MAKTAVVAGASGLIGSNLLELLLKSSDFSEVSILVRKLLPLKHPKLRQIELSFDELESFAPLIKGNALYCCLGSTSKKTPDKADYRKVDYDYPLTLAKIAKANKISQYHLVSAMGADKNSLIFYNRLKGEVEAAIEKLNLESLYIYRPSLLTGDRKEHRRGEKLAAGIMNILDPLMIGGLKKYRSIKAEVVARAMLNQTL